MPTDAVEIWQRWKEVTDFTAPDKYGRLFRSSAPYYEGKDMDQTLDRGFEKTTVRALPDPVHVKDREIRARFHRDLVTSPTSGLITTLPAHRNAYN
ncbi:unnamed protein product [Peniophora sp. CBMAI 1063]|nr:unnamed protein product [Peniophora sp. CBMAI 1063]